MENEQESTTDETIINRILNKRDKIKKEEKKNFFHLNIIKINKLNLIS